MLKVSFIKIHRPMIKVQIDFTFYYGELVILIKVFTFYFVKFFTLRMENKYSL